MTFQTSTIGYITRQVVMTNGFLRELATGAPTLARGCGLTWSPDGRYIALREATSSNPDGGSPMLVSDTGEVLRCPDNAYFSYGQSRSWVISGTQIVTVDSWPSDEPDRIILLDMQTCQEITTLYTAKSSAERLFEASISTRNWLAIDKAMGDRHSILIRDPSGTDIVTIQPGRWPTWSPDGNWLAYTINDGRDNQDGIYIIDKTGMNQRKVVQSHGCAWTSWSPDGQWLIYKCAAPGHKLARRVNIGTGEILDVPNVTGQASWRWTTPSE